MIAVRRDRYSNVIYNIFVVYLHLKIIIIILFIKVMLRNMRKGVCIICQKQTLREACASKHSGQAVKGTFVGKSSNTFFRTILNSICRCFRHYIWPFYFCVS